MAPAQRILIYLLRRDLRLADSPIFHELGKQSNKSFTHLLPLYVFPAAQVEISGFLKSDNDKSPYPEARSRVGNFWRCGKHRAKFLAESVWDLKSDLERHGSTLAIRVGTARDTVRSILDDYRDRDDMEVHGLWMTGEDGWEEKVEEDELRDLLHEQDKEFRIWQDEKYFVDDRDLPFKDPKELSDVFTEFRKTVEPLRNAPREEQSIPKQLPPPPGHIPEQPAPFVIKDSLEAVISALYKPLETEQHWPNTIDLPKGASSAHPFKGGSGAGHERIEHLIKSGSMSSYKDTRNGLLGEDFSTKLSAWLALGCITARQVHWRLIEFEDGKTDLGKGAHGYGKGENKGTAAVRFELLWRDYMRLCTRKFGRQLFYAAGFRRDKEAVSNWFPSPYAKTAQSGFKQDADAARTRAKLNRFLDGRTGTGMIDASQRELLATGWTSNRARQNVASYLAKRLYIDWRVGAEWYEMLLVDFDVSSNWGNWQYNSGVGNDPRGESRVFNPVKQSFDYDKKGDYVRTWIPELREVGHSEDGSTSQQNLMGLFQPWKLSQEDKRKNHLEGVEWVEDPLVRVSYNLSTRGGGQNRGRGRGRGRGGGGGGGGRAG